MIDGFLFFACETAFPLDFIFSPLDIIFVYAHTPDIPYVFDLFHVV